MPATYAIARESSVRSSGIERRFINEDAFSPDQPRNGVTPRSIDIAMATGMFTLL